MNKQEKRSTDIIITEILKSLRSGEKSISDIAKDTGINWGTAANHVKTLEKSGIISRKNEGNKIIYSILQKNNNTLFGLPLDSEQENKIKFIFNKIIDKYKEKHGKKPTNTYLHKTFVYINEVGRLNLPVVWYLYGQMCVMGYSENQTYDNYIPFEDMNKIEKIIDISIDKYDNKKTSEIRDKQYKEKNNNLYQAKEELYKSLKNTKELQFQQEFMKFFGIIIKEIDDDNEISDILTEYLGIVTRIKEDIRKYELFDEIWRFIALKIAVKDLEKYYDKKLLNYFFNNRIIEQEEIINERFSNIYGENNLIPLESHPELTKFREQGR